MAINLKLIWWTAKTYPIGAFLPTNPPTQNFARRHVFKILDLSSHKTSVSLHQLGLLQLVLGSRPFKPLHWLVFACLSEFIVTCVLHANSVCIFGKVMCVTQTQKDQKDFLWTCLLAGFHVTWFHHPSWPNCWQKLRQLDGDVLDQHEAGFQMRSAHAMPGEQSPAKPSHLSYL